MYENVSIIKVLGIHLGFFVLACVIVAGLVELFSIPLPFSTWLGVITGGLSQTVAVLVLSRETS